MYCDLDVVSSITCRIRYHSDDTQVTFSCSPRLSWRKICSIAPVGDPRELLRFYIHRPSLIAPQSSSSTLRLSPHESQAESPPPSINHDPTASRWSCACTVSIGRSHHCASGRHSSSARRLKSGAHHLILFFVYHRVWFPDQLLSFSLRLYLTIPGPLTLT